MKKSLVFIYFFVLTSSFALAEGLKGNIISGKYQDFFNDITLSAEQKSQIEAINKEEEAVLKPYILDLQAKESGLEFLNGLSCGRFDKNCKQKLQEDIQQREFEKQELMRKIHQKKSYYAIRYRNVLTREQDIQIRKKLEEAAHRDKVLKERMERQKKQERFDKFKIWKKSKNK